MYLECTCTEINTNKWERLMEGAKKMSKKRLNKLVKEELPELYKELSLNFYNPYDYFQTKTHYILVHSGIEYFINKKRR